MKHHSQRQHIIKVINRETIMGFNYSYTCPDVDAKIKDAKDLIESNVQDILFELNPLSSQFCNLPEELQDWIDQTTLQIYNDLEDIFEGCRTINEDMRTSADAQIREYEDEISDLQQQIKDLEEEA